MASKIERDFVLFARKASTFLSEEKVENATNLCEAGVRRFPYYAEGHYILGRCYEQLNRLEDAKSEFERVLFYNNMHIASMRRLAMIYRANGLNDMAAEMLLREALYNPLDERLHDLLREAEIYERFKNHFGGSSLTPPRGNIDPKDDMTVDESALSESFEEEHSVEEAEDTRKAAEASDAPAKKSKLPEAEHVANTEDDFSTLMNEIFEEETTEEEKQKEQEWMEVENLLVDQQEESDGEPAGNEEEPMHSNREHTEILLKELSREDEQQPAVKDEEESDSAAKEQNDSLAPAEEDEDSQRAAAILPEDPGSEPAPAEPQEASGSFTAADDTDEEKVTIEHLMRNPNLITPTFGEILIAQRKFEEARHVFNELAKNEPDSKRLQTKIEFLNRLLEAQD